MFLHYDPACIFLLPIMCQVSHQFQTYAYRK
jgi:hypothetical protein